jgi:hypothetical protein
MSRPGLTLLLCTQAQMCKAESLVHSVDAGDIALANQQPAQDAAATAADTAITAAPGNEPFGLALEVHLALHYPHGLPLHAVAELRLAP